MGIPLSAERSGVLLDPNTKNILSEQQLKSLEKYGPVRKISGCVWHVIDALLQSKYYIRLGNKPVMGNSSIEAVASGCLFISSPLGIKNNPFVNEETRLNSDDLNTQFEYLQDRLNYFEMNEDLLNEQLKIQRDLLDYLCFTRPMGEILSRI